MIVTSPVSALRHAAKVLLTSAIFLTPALFLHQPAQAQSPKEIAEITHTLSPASQKVIERLSTLNNLPAEQWRYHAGDFAHGESPSTDDSSWPLVKAKSEAPKEAVWFRREIEVPQTLNGYDLTGARVSFRFRANANGPVPEIIYFNGRRVALGEDLEPIVLFDDAKPGDKVLVAVKLLPTVDEKRIAGGRSDS